MNPSLPRRMLAPTPLFCAIGAGIVGVSVAIIHSSLFLREPEIAAWAVTFDLCLTLPAVYYFLVVARRHARLTSIIPLFLAMIFLAGLIVPKAHQQLLHTLVLASAPLELIVVGFVIAGIRRIRRQAREGGNDDPLTLIGRASRELLGDNRAAEVVAFELCICYYALFGWRRRPERGDQVYTVGGTTDWATIVAALILMISAEMVGQHLLIRLWSAKVAWTLTGLDLYSILWLLGDYQALRLRVITTGTDGIRVRFGLRWSAEIPFHAIESAEVQSSAETPSRQHLKLAVCDSPRLLLRLREPVTARGLFGMKRSVRSVSLGVEQVDRLERAIGEHGKSGRGVPGSCRREA